MTQRELERQISQTYGQARKNIARHTEEYFEEFQKRDESKRKEVADGITTEKEYQDWLNGEKTYMTRNEQLLRSVSEEYRNADKTAEKWINGELPYSYVAGYNATGTGIQGEISGYSFCIIDKNAVKSMMQNGDIPIATYTAGTEKHTAYVDKKARQAITQGIIQGKSVSNVAANVNKALGVVTDRERKATIRNTRTLMNSAHNSGGYEAMADASKDGIILDKQWLATKDERTRDSHAHLDGEIVKWNEEFSNGLRFPQDPRGEAEEVYNCRCAMQEITRGFYNKYTGKTVMMPDTPQDEYAAESKAYWNKYFAEKKQKEKFENGETVSDAERNVVTGRDLTAEWSRRRDEFEFEIEDIINAQGFDGLPKIVSEEEFNKAVAEANGGKGFIAQRTYSAPDKETLDEYRDMLYNGKWYVDCGTGGAQYGQGMYCAADYTGKLSDGIKAEMEHYAEIGKDRTMHDAYLSKLDKTTADDIRAEIKGLKATDEEIEAWKYVQANGGYANLPDTTEARAMWNKSNNISKADDDKLLNWYAKEEKSFKKTYTGTNYTETMTLDPSAKIINYEELDRARTYGNLEQKIVDNMDIDDISKETLTKWVSDEGDIKDLPPNLQEHAEKIEKQADMLMEADYGTLATALGYDAINAVGHGKSGSYTVILNRTKVIIKG